MIPFYRLPRSQGQAPRICGQTFSLMDECSECFGLTVNHICCNILVENSTLVVWRGETTQECFSNIIVGAVLRPLSGLDLFERNLEVKCLSSTTQKYALGIINIFWYGENKFDVDPLNGILIPDMEIDFSEENQRLLVFAPHKLNFFVKIQQILF